MTVYSTSSDYAKDVWLPVYNNQFMNDEGSLLKQVGMDWDAPVKIEGRNTYMKIQVGEDLGFGAINGAGGDLPTPGDIQSDEATLSLMHFGSAIQLDGHEKALVNSLDSGAAPDIMAKKMSASRMRVMRELERMAIMDGTGILAKHASDSGATITLDVAGAEYPERNAYTWIDDTNRSRYSLVNPTTGADVTQGWTISSIVESTNVITTSATQTTGTAADVIVTDYGASAWASGGAFRSLEFPGLLGIIDDDNTYLGINRATAALGFWRAVVDGNSGTNRTFTETLAMSVLAKLARRCEGGVVTGKEHFGLASFGTWNSYHQLMSPGIRYTASETPDIGWGGRESLPMHGVPLYKHVKAPRNTVLIVHRPSTHFVTAKNGSGGGIFNFLEGDSGIWFQKTAATGQGYADAQIAYITGWLGMYSDKPRNNARLDDLTETAGSY
jgi:hypothetical protein